MKVCILNFYHRLCKFFSAASLISTFSLLFLSSCGFKVGSIGSNLFSNPVNIVSGVVSPLVGLISENQSNQHFLITNAYSAVCTDPVYAKFYHLENDGTITEGSPISTQQLTADARYSFDLDELNLNSSGTNVEYIVKVEGCNGNVYKRPITNIDSSQDLNVKTTVVANVTNSSTLLSKTLNQVSKTDVANLINSVSGTTTGAALTSLTNDPKATNQFNQIFGAPPTVVLSAKPDVILNYPSTAINELAISNFSVSAFQMNPAYSIAYTWKLDGVVKSHSSSWNYIPGANDSGTHQIDVYVGSDDGSGNIDTTKPFYTNTTSINVNNNILPTPPNITINSGTPSPVYTNSISVDLATGVNKANCASFSHLAITDSATPPGVMQFSIDCANLGTQTENVIFSSGDGAKTLYLWAIDNEGMISSAKTVSLVLDTLPPFASLSFNPSFVKGGTTQTITLSASDAGTGLNSLDLYYSSNGGTSYSLLSHLSNTDTAYNWSVPLVDLSNVKLKLVATDFTSSATSAYSGIFSIDSTPPAAPTLSRTSASVSSSRTVTIGVTCTADFDKILFSQSSATPSGTDSNWESCSTSKNFSVTTGDELKTIYAFTKDAAGNISTSSNVTMTLDTTLPVLALNSLNSGGVFKGGSSQSINWTASDTNLDSISISYSTNGTTYTSIASAIANSGSYSWTLPALDSSTVTLKISAVDFAGNIKLITSSNFTIDSTAPTLSLTDVADTLRGANTTSLNYSASDTNTVSTLKLYYAADGVNYGSAINLTVGSTNYTWTIPTDNVSAAKLKLVATDNVGNASTVTSGVFTVDSTPPSAPVIARTSAVTSNSTTVALSTTCTGDYDKILYTQTSLTPSESDSAWESCANTKSFTVSTGDGLKAIYAFTKDAVGNISTSSNVTMTLDMTPPVAPVANLASANISSSTTASFTITNCLDRPYVLVSESMIAPLVGDANWQTCSTGTGAINYVMVGPVLEQIHTLYVYAKDAVGNISASTSASMIYDITNPSLSLSTSLGFLYKGGDIVPLNFSASDTNGLSAFRLEYTTDGTNYNLVTTLAANATTYNWTVPASNTTTAKIRLVAVDNAVAANTSTVYSGVFTVDSTSPTAPSLARTSAAISNSSNVTMNVGSCVDTTYILISETNTQPAIGDSNWQLCSTTAGNYTATVSGNGVHTFYAWAKDLAGNRAATANSITMTYDTTAPVLALTSFNSGVFAGNQTQNITWTLSDTNLGSTPVDLYYSTDSGSTWNTITTAIANTSSFSWATPSIEGSTVKLKVVATDLAGNTSVATSSSNLIFDSTPASIASLSLNNGASSTLNASVAVNFSASSSQGPAKITQFCLKYNNATTPTAADSCWVSLTRSDVNVTPATSIAVSNFYFSLGFSPVAYTVYGYVKDEAGQISSSNSSSITLIPATPPVITNIIVANYDNPTMPLTVQDTTFPLHSDVYINWNITDANGLQPNSVKLEYTLDEVTWTTITSGLSETNQSGCTVMSGANGCYLWSAGAPTDNGVGTPGNATDDKTFKIRITALNISQLSTLGTSNNVNSGNLALIAGNTNTGLNGSASSAIFPMITSVGQVTNGSFVMSSKGEFFYIDYTRGLLYVSPNDGIQKKLITTNGTFGVENGSIASTYLKLPYKIGIDYQDNLYVYDSDRIRKINTNTNPMTITTIIGGGANNDMTTKSGTSLQIVPAGYTNAQNGYDFHVLGNGDIWFTGETYDGNQISYRRRYRFYNHNDGNVYSYNLSGTGNLSNSSIDLTASTTALKQSAIAYDVNTFALTKIIASSGATGIGTGVGSFNLSTLTSQAPHPGGALSAYGYYDSTYTGLDGNIYFLDYNMAAVRKYNIASNSFSAIYGSGAGGYCPSGTTVTSCNALIGGVFVNKQGKLFVVDNGIIRTIDDNGKVQDLFGQASSYGENTLATNARFKDISSLGVWYDSSSGKTKVIVNDRFGYKIKEFPVGGNITTIAGTGLQNASPTKNVDALTIPINSDGANGSTNNVNMLVDASNGYVYKGVGSVGNYVLQRAATNKWQDVITAGAGPFTNMDSDSLIGNPIAAGNVTFGNYSTTHFMGVSTNYILMLDHDYDGAAAQHRGGAILLYDRINNTIEKIAGKYGQPNVGFSLCADGNLPTSCIGYYTLQTVGNGYTQAFYDATLDAWIMASVGTNKVRILKKGTNMSTIATLSANLRSLTYLRIGGASPTKHKIWYCTTGGVLREYDLLASTDTALSWTISNMGCYSNYLAYSPQRNSLIFPVLQNNLAGVAEYLLP